MAAGSRPAATAGGTIRLRASSRVHTEWSTVRPAGLSAQVTSTARASPSSNSPRARWGKPASRRPSARTFGYIGSAGSPPRPRASTARLRTSATLWAVSGASTAPLASGAVYP